MDELLVKEKSILNNTDSKELIQARRQKEELICNRIAMGTLNLAKEQYLEKFSNSHTEKAKRSDLDQFIQFLRPKKIILVGDLAYLTVLEIDRLVDDFLDQRLELDSVITVQRKKGSIRGMFQVLNKYVPELVPYIPEIDADRFKESRSIGVTESLEFEEWLSFKEQLKKARNKELLILAYFALLTGGRRLGECLSVCWQDMDFNKNQISIIPLKKKSAEKVILPMHPKLKEILQPLAKEKSANEKVFKTSQQSVDKSFKLYAGKAGINKKISFHSLRATFITWGLERGDTMSELMNASLHKSTKMLRYYDRSEKVKVNSINNLSI